MKLVSQSQVQSLLTDNIDEHVSNYIIFTTHGTLLTHASPTQSPSKPRYQLSQCSLTKFCPFAGSTWRAHATQVLTANTTDLSIGTLPQCRTIAFKLKQVGSYQEPLTDVEDDDEDEEGQEKGGLESQQQAEFPQKSERQARYELDQLTLEIDGVISVLRLIATELLVAAQLPRREFRAEEDEVSKRIFEDEEDEESEDDDDEDAEGNGEYHEDCHESQKGKVGKMRILELRCEGMAEALGDDYPERLPHDFY